MENRHILDVLHLTLFGANVSGKSNVIKAIRACVNTVRSSHNYNVDTWFVISPFKGQRIFPVGMMEKRLLISGLLSSYSKHEELSMDLSSKSLLINSTKLID